MIFIIIMGHVIPKYFKKKKTKDKYVYLYIEAKKNMQQRKGCDFKQTRFQHVVEKVT